MKKVFAGIFAAALAAVMCVAFVGCGENGGNGGNGGNGESGGSGGNNESGVNAKEFVGEIVTEAQWKAAFEFFKGDDAEFTVEMDSSSTTTVTVDLTETGGKRSSGIFIAEESGTFINYAAKQSLTSSYTTSVKGDFPIEELAELMHSNPEKLKETWESEEYAVRGDAGKYTVYEKNDADEWETSEGRSLDPMKYYYPEGDFADFKYDETLKGYVDADYEADDTHYYVYKFNEQGRLAAIFVYEIFTDTLDGNELTSVAEVNFIFTYTAKDFSLPNVGA